MRWADIPFDASHRTLRQFAGLWIVFFGALACYWGLGRDSPTAGVVLGVLALTVGVLGLVRPEAVRPVFAAWLVLAFPVGWAVSHLLLAVLYYGLFTPLALAFRLAGRDLLMRHRRPETESYWLPKPAVADLRRYYRQF